MNIIGITGSIGSGKGTIVDYLVKERGYVHFSARTLITSEVEKRGLPLDRDSMTKVSNELREKHSPSFIIESLYHQAKELGRDCIIESIRTEGEINALREIGHFHLFGVTADLKTRYERIIERNSATDHITFEEFEFQDKREMESSDPNKQNLSACLRHADFVFHNEGTIPELNKEVEEVLESF